ncbi:MAG: hypothetical protein WA667_11835 [Candidatus Nitrosopolaris sp.]
MIQRDLLQQDILALKNSQHIQISYNNKIFYPIILSRSLSGSWHYWFDARRVLALLAVFEVLLVGVRRRNWNTGIGAWKMVFLYALSSFDMIVI